MSYRKLIKSTIYIEARALDGNYAEYVWRVLDFPFANRANIQPNVIFKIISVKI